MIYKAYTVVFEGVEARSIEVQCALSAGLPGFSIMGKHCKPSSIEQRAVLSHGQNLCWNLSVVPVATLMAMTLLK